MREFPSKVQQPVESKTGQSAIRAAIYARISSANQKNNYSINEQIACCRKYIDQKGWTVHYLFFDEAEGGSSIERPKFQSMLERARAGCFDVIVVWKLDRFCRSLVDLVNVEKALRECGVSLCSVTEFLTRRQPLADSTSERLGLSPNWNVN